MKITHPVDIGEPRMIVKTRADPQAGQAEGRALRGRVRAGGDKANVSLPVMAAFTRASPDMN